MLLMQAFFYKKSQMFRKHQTCSSNNWKEQEGKSKLKSLVYLPKLRKNFKYKLF